MIEEFSFTTKYFDKEVREANNQLAALSWARLTWEQRVTQHSKVALTVDTQITDKKIYYRIGYHMIACETLSQMQFLRREAPRTG